MNAHNRRTLLAIYASVTPTGLRWRDIESLFKALGAHVREGKGSRVRVTSSDVRATFHRPHPRPTVGRLTLRDVRDFLNCAGVTVDDAE
ncbi:MAG TPA: type II toxin-antitoxin system HicA family toxin [Gemmatimonadaceae bacterium]